MQKRIKKFFRRKVGSVRVRRRDKQLHQYNLFRVIHIFVLALIICEEIIFLNHYQALLETCESISTHADAFRDLDISNDVLNDLWKSSMGNKESFIKKITMNMLLNNFSVTEKRKMIPIYWYLWDQLVPEELYDNYYNKYKAIFMDLVYFPVAEDASNGVKVVFDDSWLKERNYGGQRGHEGTDIMSENNVRGYFPVLSISDGTVEQKGWLEMGGYRIGIRSTNGAYFYYAHLDSYAPELEVGDPVSAGQLLGMMGDTGYSKVEGTTGNFDVHLHVGIYLSEKEDEVSVNPYWILMYLKDNKIKWNAE